MGRFTDKVPGFGSSRAGHTAAQAQGAIAEAAGGVTEAAGPESITTDAGGSPDPTAQEFLDALAPILARDPRPRLRANRAGHYLITDASGDEVGTLYGDYVVGFTVECWGLNRWFPDLEGAKAAIAAEAQTRAEASSAAAGTPAS